MSRYLIGQALGLVVDVAREKVREVTGIADRERAYTQAMVDLATVCDDARRYLRELDAARAEVERLGDVIAGLREVTEAARAAWPIVARAVDCDADAALAERLRLALAAAGLPVDELPIPNPGTPAVTARESHEGRVGCQGPGCARDTRSMDGRPAGS